MNEIRSASAISNSVEVGGVLIPCLQPKSPRSFLIGNFFIRNKLEKFRIKGGKLKVKVKRKW